MIENIEWDSEFFGRKIGRLSSVPGGDDLLREELADAACQGFRYLTCRLGAYDIPTAQRLERQGFYLTDVGIVWDTVIKEAQEPQVPVREGILSDAEGIRKIAEGIFKDGRFYFDPFFTKEEANRLYQAWAENSLRGQADKVFLLDGRGFVTCKILDGTGDIPLIGVAAPYQGQGIGAALVQAAVNWFRVKGVKRVTVRTQAGNTRAIHFYERNGFHVVGIDMTMGKIFPEN